MATLELNRQVTGNIETPFSVDRWTFVGVAGQQVQFDLVNSTSTSLRFSLTGPAGFTGFTDLPGDSGLVTLTATTAAGHGEYAVIDVRTADGLALAHHAVPGLLEPFLQHEVVVAATH